MKTLDACRVASLASAVMFAVAAAPVHAAGEPAGAAPTAAAPSPAEQDAAQRAKAAAKELAETLMGRLKAALQERGPAGAVEVCNAEAQGLTAAIGQKYGLSIKRVSDRNRNPLNAASEAEARFIAEAQARKEAGEAPDSLAKVFTEQGAEGRVLVLYKAMVMPELGKIGHGTDIAPDVKAVIDQHYPNDKARGYRPGDVRGLIVVRVPLKA
ncbi:DUF3365 domain-containing protein [Aquabacterium sp.]|uniref:c-type heme family protein n=1 Tax=Aquabacterium sp. TaxID=1872578 RepID=UPI0035AFE317